MYKLGDLATNIEVLKAMRDKLVENEQVKDHKNVEDGKWGSLTSASSQILEACQKKDLGELARAMRVMKNRLRRPAIRRELAMLDQLESDEKPDEISDKEKQRDVGKDKKGNPTGKCRCAKCDKIIDGSEEPCLKGALCVDDATKKDVIPKDDQIDKSKQKAVPQSAAMMGMMGGMGGSGGLGTDVNQSGVEGQKKEDRSSLRRRSY